MSKNFKLKLPLLHFGGKTYKLGLGGIHSVDKEQQSVYKSNEDYMILDADVTSFYPMSIILNNICPEHLDLETFKKTLEQALEDRKNAKKKKKESLIYAALEYGLKIGLNSVFGLFAYANFMLLDLMATYKTTVNNQLFILQLIELLVLENIEVISANTDGITLYFLRSEYDIVLEICEHWEKETGFSLEYVEYDLYIRTDVNNYIARKIDGTVKVKGKFVPSGARLYPYFKYEMPFDNGFYMPVKGILKGYSVPPVIPLALHHYFLSGIEPEEFIYNHQDIYDFCSSQKVGNQFTNILEYVKRQIIFKKPSRIIKKKIQDKIKAEYTNISSIKKLKDGSIKEYIKKVKIKDGKPAKYEYVEIEGEFYANPRVTDCIIKETVVQKTVRYYITIPSVDEEGNLFGYSLKKEKYVDLWTDKKEKKRELQQEIFAWLLLLYRLSIYDNIIFLMKEVLRKLSKFNLERTDYCAKQFVKLFMNYEEKSNFDEYNINYDYYIDQTKKIIEEIKSRDFKQWI